MNSSLTQLDQIKGTLIDLAIRFGPKLLAAILIMTAGAFAAGWAGRMTARAWSGRSSTTTAGSGNAR